MKCPYSLETIMNANITLNAKLDQRYSGNEVDDVSAKELEKLGEKFGARLPANNKIKKKMVAAYHGVSVTDLISSRNYSILVEEYDENVINDAIDAIKTKLDLNNEEAWALLLSYDNENK